MFDQGFPKSSDFENKSNNVPNNTFTANTLFGNTNNSQGNISLFNNQGTKQNIERLPSFIDTIK